MKLDRKDLFRHSDYEHEMRSREERQQSLRLEINSIKSQRITDMPRGGEPLLVADKIVILLDLENEINEIWGKKITLRIAVEKQLNAMENPIYRRILHLRYIECLRWLEIAKKIGYSESHTKDVLNDLALNQFENLNAS